MAESGDRRRFLHHSLLGAAGVAALSLEEKILLAALQQEAEKKPSSPPQDERPMPFGQIGNFKISRMLIGGNLIGGCAHSRDLLYVARLFKAYNTDEKVFETLALCEAQGINTVQLDPACINVFHRYLTERGGKMQALLCVYPDADTGKVKSQLEFLLSKGATFFYTHGGATDQHMMNGRLDVVAKTVQAIKEMGVPAGVGSHALSVPVACEKNDVGAEFYVKTLHSDKYWSATPENLREDFGWFKPRGDQPFSFNDNMWCINPEETIEFMKSIRKPWFAFKVLAAGAIHPRIAFPYVLRNGADFVIVGMFDFQIAEDTAIFKEAYYKLGEKRDRPWCA